MELSRLGRVIHDRWWILAIGAVLGMVVAIVLSTVHNTNLEPVFESTAGVRFELEEAQTFTDLADALAEAQSVATFAAQDILKAELQSGKTMSFIVADQAAARLLFISRGSSPDEAGERALALRQAYFDVDPESVGNVDDLLRQTEAEVVAAEAELLAIRPAMSEADEELLRQYDLLDQQIAAVTARLVALTVEDASASSEQSQLNTQERSELNETLTSLRTEVDALPARPGATPTADEQMRITTLERRIELLTLEYERLYLRKLGVAGLGEAEPVAFVNITPSPASPIVMGIGGLIGGALLVLFGLVLATRIRKPIWLPEDISILLLGAVPARRVLGGTAEVWYDKAESSPRKSAIQRLRSVVEAQLPAGGASLAVAGHNLHAQNLQAVASDLAVSMASAGSSVLLVDGDFGSTSALGDYKVGGSSLSDVLALNPDSLGFETQVSRAVDGAHFIRPGLAIVPSGPAPTSPADALAGRQFRRFLEKSMSQFDLVVVVVGDIAAPAAQVAMQRLMRGLLVLTPGRSTIRDIDNALFDVSQRQVSMLGAVFLERSERIVRDQPSKLADEEQRLESAPTAESPISRLDRYSRPSEQVSTAVETDVLRGLVDEFGAIDTGQDRDGMLGSTLLAALRDADTKGAYEAVVEYLVSRVEDLFAAGGSPSNLSEEYPSSVAASGFAPLSELSDYPTVGQWIKAEIEREATSGTAVAIIDAIENVLTEHDGKVSDLDEWLSDNFFKLHVRRTAGQPVVWHLTSGKGEVEILAAARRLNRGGIKRLIEEVAGQRMEELKRYRRAAETRRDIEQAAALTTRIDEVHEFGDALGTLIGLGSLGKTRKKATDSSKDLSWDLDLSAGVRPNLAPFQRVGVLAFRVLSEDELSSDLAVS